MTVREAEWDAEQRGLMLTLAEWEAGRCPGCGHQLDETTDPDAEAAYVHGDEARCHACTAQARYVEELKLDEYQHREAIYFTPPRRRVPGHTTPVGG